MIVNDFSHDKSILNQFIAELRSVDIQKDSMRFRKNIERIGEILSYQLSETLSYEYQTISTPLGSKKTLLPTDKLVLCSVLRAGLPLHQGLLNYFDKAENSFISAFRQHTDQSDEFKVVVNYLASPDLSDKVLVLSDPMLATGKTMENVYKALKDYGVPRQIHIVSVIGSTQGVDHISAIFPENTQLWIAAVDDQLDHKGYIVPGLGDAGDLAFGLKL